MMGLALSLAAVVAGCRQVDIRTAVLYVPAMTNQACVNVVLKALNTEQGISSPQVTVRQDSCTLEVRYDSLRHSLKNLEFTVADAGFAANDIPANVAAQQALPPECR
ncbi:MAG: heavy-metal-associated domain-containing protein [Lentisphaerae bacterium]|nr:heavy-metal-associated domain-containing protein [Lentisphaerota bacterium]